MSSGAFAATHVAPPEGMQAWDAPDPTRPPVAQISGGVEMRLIERRGAWGRVSFANGWSGWVDGRRIVDAPNPPPAPPQRLPSPVPAPPQADVRPQAARRPVAPPVERPDAQPFWAPAQAPRPAPDPAQQAAAPRTAAQPAPQRPAHPEPGPEPEPVPRAQPKPDGPSTTGQPREAAPASPAPSPASSGPASSAPASSGPATPAPSASSRSFPDLGNVKVTPGLLGAAAVLIGSLLSWVRIFGERGNAYEVPVEFLWNYKTASGAGVKVGLLLLILSAVGGALCFLPGRVLLRRIAGGAVVVVALLYTVQLQRWLSDAGAAAPSIPSALGFGVVVALAGGVALLVDGSDAATRA